MNKYLYISLCLTALLVHNQSFGFDRLFTTAKEREAIDNIRYKRIEPVVPENKTVAKPVKLKLSGVMARNGGQNTAWINGQAVKESESINQSKVNLINKSNVSINVAPLKGTITLLPGQRYSSTQAGTTEGYEN